jgi:hypothetical protein
MTFDNEPQVTSSYWKNILSDDVIEPTFDNPQIWTNLDKFDEKLCCLYIVYGKEESFYGCSQKVLDDMGSNLASHIKAMNRFLDGQGKKLKGKKLNYVIGFYYNNGQLLIRSCVNFYYSKSRDAKKSDENKIKEKLEAFIKSRISNRRPDNDPMGTVNF